MLKKLLLIFSVVIILDFTLNMTKLLEGTLYSIAKENNRSSRMFHEMNLARNIEHIKKTNKKYIPIGSSQIESIMDKSHHLTLPAMSSYELYVLKDLLWNKFRNKTIILYVGDEDFKNTNYSTFFFGLPRKGLSGVVDVIKALEEYRDLSYFSSSSALLFLEEISYFFARRNHIKNFLLSTFLGETEKLAPPRKDIGSDLLTLDQWIDVKFMYLEKLVEKLEQNDNKVFVFEARVKDDYTRVDRRNSKIKKRLYKIFSKKGENIYFIPALFHDNIISAKDFEDNTHIVRAKSKELHLEMLRIINETVGSTLEIQEFEE